MTGHPEPVGPTAAVMELGGGPFARPRSELRLDQIYEQHFDFVWRSARRMGVPDASADDVVQEVFLVAHRRLSEFEGRSSLRTWLFAILLRVVADHRRTLRRKGGLAPLPETLADPEDGRSPAELTAQRERVQLLHRLLETLDEEKRAVFVLAELEQMTAPEISDALGINLNTVYSRLRAARQRFDEALARHRAREARG